MRVKERDYINLDVYLKNVPKTIFSVSRPVAEKKDLEVLRVLLRKKDITRYRIGRELIGQYSTASREFTKLKERGLLEVTQIRERGKQTVYDIKLSNVAIRALLVRTRGKYSDIHNELDSKLPDLFRDIKTNYPEFLPEDIRNLSINFLRIFYPIIAMSGSLSPRRVGPVLFRIALIDIFLTLLNAKRRKKTSTLYITLEGKDGMLSILDNEEDYMINYIEKQLENVKDVLSRTSLKIDESTRVKLDEQALALERYK